MIVNEHECAVAQLPATHHEVSAIMSITPKKALALLYHAMREGLCVKSELRVRNGNKGRGAHNSTLWLRT